MLPVFLKSQPEFAKDLAAATNADERGGVLKEASRKMGQFISRTSGDLPCRGKMVGWTKDDTSCNASRAGFLFECVLPNPTSHRREPDRPCTRRCGDTTYTIKYNSGAQGAATRRCWREACGRTAQGRRLVLGTFAGTVDRIDFTHAWI